MPTGNTGAGFCDGEVEAICAVLQIASPDLLRGEEEAAVDQMPDPPVADRHYRNFQGVSDHVRRHPELNRLTLHNDGSPVE